MLCCTVPYVPHCTVQPQRTRTSEAFRSAKRGIMFSSDVTARGLDYPDVTLVLQVRHRERERERERGKRSCGDRVCDGCDSV